MCDAKCPLRDGHPPATDAALRVVGPSRRQFIAQTTLAAAAALLASACGDGEIGGVGPAAPTVIEDDLVIRIADYPALQQVGGMARVASAASNPIAVTRTGPNTFVALSLVCPHAGYKPIDITSSGFRCPNHNAMFAADGNWVGGQRTRDLQSYPVAYDASTGTLTIG